jgi:glucoamylase
MPKSLVLGNGNILISLDNRGQVRDFYFPYVGLENQAGSLFCHRIGVFVDGKISWFKDSDWEIHINYQEETLVSDIQAANMKLELRIDFSDVVYNEKNIFIRKAVIHNLADRKREIKLYFHQQFEMYESHRGDTSYFDPYHNVIIHYKGRRVFMINAKAAGKSFDDYSVGLFNIEGKEGTYKDAEDGKLSKNPVEHGLVDSTIGITTTIDSRKSETVFYWVVAAKYNKEANEINQYVLDKTPQYLMGTTRDFWHAWVNKLPFKFVGLDEAIVRLYKKSLLIIRTHVDNRGAIIASGDTDILTLGRDAYGYMWPRDGAIIAMSLDKSGDSFVIKKFFEFCNEVVTDDGYFLQRYRADRSLGSSWHPWQREGNPELPIQEDETALIIHALWRHYEITKDLEFIEDIYNSLIKKCADFMVAHRDAKTGLPKPSYDLWEEKWGVHTFTAATVYSALISASKFAALLGKSSHESTYRTAAQEIQKAILQYLYDEEGGYFYKMINFEKDKTIIDKTIDSSSVYGVWHFGVLSPNDEKVKRAIKLTEEHLTVKSEVGGLVRYENDAYFREDEATTGNAWYITTLWLAKYYIAIANNQEDLKKGQEILQWVVKYSLSSGILSEQLHPHSGAPISATPLIWSHAEYVVTVINYLEKLKELGLCEDCDPLD